MKSFLFHIKHVFVKIICKSISSRTFKVSDCLYYVSDCPQIVVRLVPIGHSYYNTNNMKNKKWINSKKGLFIATFDRNTIIRNLNKLYSTRNGLRESLRTARQMKKITLTYRATYSLQEDKGLEHKSNYAAYLQPLCLSTCKMRVRARTSHGEISLRQPTMSRCPKPYR